MTRATGSIIAVCAGLLLAVISANAESDGSDDQKSESSGIYLALSGGGARGLAHIGVLQALAELRVPVAGISGASFGAMVGALYAGGQSPDAIAELASNLPWDDVLTERIDWADRRFEEKDELRSYFLKLEFGLGGGHGVTASGVLAGQRLESQLRAILHGNDLLQFDDLILPFSAVATDINQAESITIDSGDLMLALRASMAIPLVLQPVSMDGRVLVDGGILNNLPVDVARSMGGDTVVAVNVASPLGEAHSGSSLFEIAYQSIDTALIQNTLASLNDADLIIAPTLEGLSATDFKRAEEFIKAGYEATMKKRSLLSGLSVSADEYAAYTAGLVNPNRLGSDPIAFVEFDGQERMAVKRLQALARGLEGEAPDLDALEKTVSAIYATQEFVNVRYELIANAAGERGVRFDLEEKSWGPDVLKFGLSIAADINVDTDFSLLIGHRRRNINSLGAEWANDIEIGSEFGWLSTFYQPLDFSERYFVRTWLDAEERVQRIFSGDQQVAEFEISNAAIGADVGLNIDNGRFYAGLWRGIERSDLDIGNDALGLFPSYSDDEGAWRLGFSLDNQNARLFATSGHRVDGSVNFFETGLGAEIDYERYDFQGQWRYPFGEQNGIHLEAIAKSIAGNDGPLPGSAYVTLGGLDDLAGVPDGSLIGTRALAFRAGLISGIQPLDIPVLGPPRIIALVHGGQVWEETESVSLSDFRYGAMGGLAVDVLGAILFGGVGYTEGGEARYYLRIGTGF